MLTRSVLSWTLATLSILCLLIIQSLLDTPSASLQSMWAIVALWCIYVGSYVATGMAALFTVGLFLRRVGIEFKTAATCLVLMGAMLGGLSLWSANVVLGMVAGLFSAIVWVRMNRHWFLHT